jgi:hypothetical protein
MIYEASICNEPPAKVNQHSLREILSGPRPDFILSHVQCAIVGTATSVCHPKPAVLDDRV